MRCKVFVTNSNLLEAEFISRIQTRIHMRCASPFRESQLSTCTKNLIAIYGCYLSPAQIEHKRIVDVLVSKTFDLLVKLTSVPESVIAILTSSKEILELHGWPLF
ncbi:hypothetical protein M758_2G033800 [Ceratodon purpureus]|uniref:Uncharacterized protein n=1 Tax=Ceratodon purpureus TaxID=3225 RepID=A0A8T0ITP2_CERPU|nr:hypothetical protein KC19_2G034700 [Ceratodon purpureus]KAG0625178.1 hypothetical protein M758_2G033800 [Ceratodon purpureus]